MSRSSVRPPRAPASERSAEPSSERRCASAPAVPRIAPREEPGPALLSFSERRLWFLNELEPGPVFNRFAAWRLRFRVQPDVLERSLQAIVQRHAVLRTTFRVLEREPVQAAAPEAVLPLPAVNLATLPEFERMRAAGRVASEEARAPFDLARGPLLRARLLRLAQDDYILLVTMHQIVGDDRSLELLSEELEALYAAFEAGQPSPLADLPIQYADFAVWQRAWLQGPVLERLLGFWKSQLAGAPAMLELPTDHARPPIPSFQGARQTAVLPPALVGVLEALGEREGVTRDLVLLTAFQVLLARYTGSEDISVGTPVAGRYPPEVEKLIGAFADVVVLRTDLSGDPPFRELLGRVRIVAEQADAHQQLPLEKLVEELRPERHLSHNPLFQVVFAVERTPGPDPSGRFATRWEFERKTSRHDLSLFVSETTEGLACTAEYSADLFDGETIDRLLEHFEVLLRGIAAAPEERISRLPLLTPSERQRILVEWNRTEAAYPPDARVHDLFEEQVERTPDAVAVESRGKTMTYGELNRRSNRLAHHLRGLGVGPEVLVGLCMERSLEMVVGLLGILKAGGAYVPLDPGYPRERIGFMLEETRAPVLVTDDRTASLLPAGRARPVRLGAEVETAGSPENPERVGTPGNLAYVIYTSGSTGQPKGVAVSHRALANHMQWMQAAFPLLASDRVLQKTPISFDASVWEFYAPLLAGARLVMAGAESHRDTAELASDVSAHGITVLQVVPALLRIFLEEPRLARCRSLRRIFCGGGRLTPDILELLFQRLRAELHNLYGPTEATIDSTFWTCRREAFPDGIPIGRPISNTRAYLLDGLMQPLPIGVPGELYIAGESLARGYWNRPDATAAAFLPDPLSGIPGGRLYRTGDVATRSAAGDLMFLGRADHQLKIRGFRVEPGEIEATLRQHPGVRDVAVVARGDAAGEMRLVAYVVGTEAAPPPVSELRAFLRERLPEYMLPSTFEVLGFLPLTPSGKIDRRALPAPERKRPEDGLFVDPRTPVEKALAEIWKEILKVDRVGIGDDFFDLGADSLMATQVVSRVSESFGVQIPLRRVFEESSLEKLALAITHALAATATPDEILQLLARVRRLSEEEARVGTGAPPATSGPEEAAFPTRGTPTEAVGKLPETQ